MTATEVTESTERGLGGGKDISVYSVVESYKKKIWFSIVSLVPKLKYPLIHYPEMEQMAFH